jgi:hypothetical protein
VSHISCIEQNYSILSSIQETTADSSSQNSEPGHERLMPLYGFLRLMIQIIFFSYSVREGQREGAREGGRDRGSKGRREGGNYEQCET